MAGTVEGFNELLCESPHVSSLLDTKHYKPSGVIRGAPANSQRIQQFCGDAWIAVGDAAQAYDPLSSQGIDKALRTGSQAGHLIHYALTDSLEGSGLDLSNPYIRQYDQEQNQLWDAYIAQYDFYYGIQQRWTNQPFWRRRQTIANESVAH
jgi:flavin-dependent dehydrogenase